MFHSKRKKERQREKDNNIFDFKFDCKTAKYRNEAGMWIEFQTFAMTI